MRSIHVCCSFICGCRYIIILLQSRSKCTQITPSTLTHSSTQHNPIRNYSPFSCRLAFQYILNWHENVTHSGAAKTGFYKHTRQFSQDLSKTQLRLINIIKCSMSCLLSSIVWIFVVKLNFTLKQKHLMTAPGSVHIAITLDLLKRGMCVQINQHICI